MRNLFKSEEAKNAFTILRWLSDHMKKQKIEAVLERINKWKEQSNCCGFYITDMWRCSWCLENAVADEWTDEDWEEEKLRGERQECIKDGCLN